MRTEKASRVRFRVLPAYLLIAIMILCAGGVFGACGTDKDTLPGQDSKTSAADEKTGKSDDSSNLHSGGDNSADDLTGNPANNAAGADDNSKNSDEKDKSYSLPELRISTGSSHISDNAIRAELTMIAGPDLDLKDENLYNGKISVRLRGNSTRYREKAPYKIKLETKTNLLGLGRSKHWVLLAEDIDHTLSRNILTLKFARDIGISTAGNAASVSLYINDKYRGVYTLSEHVRIGKDQVDVFDWTELAEDVAKAVAKDRNFEKDVQERLEDSLASDYAWLSEPYAFSFDGEEYCAADYADIPSLTGGVLLEADFYHQNSADIDSLKTAYLQPFYVSEPEACATNPELMEYMRRYLQSFEYALHARDFTFHDSGTQFKATSGKFDPRSGWSGSLTTIEYSDPEHDGWKYYDFFDMDSLVNNFIICEFTRNWDCMKNSVFAYKDIEGKAFLAPVWDFDWAYGNINMYGIDTWFTEGWATTDDNYTREQYYQSFNWNRYLIKDPEFVRAVCEKWHLIRPGVIENLIKENGELAQRRAAMKPFGDENDAKWKHTYSFYRSKKYDESWDKMTKYINQRVKWLDEQFTDIDTLYNSLNP